MRGQLIPKRSDAKDIVRRIFEAWNSHDPDRYAALLHEERVMEGDGLPAPVVGIDASREFRTRS